MRFPRIHGLCLSIVSMLVLSLAIGCSDDDDGPVAPPVPKPLPVQLTTDAGPDQHPAWSPDGNTIAFDSYRNSNGDIWTIPSAGGAEVRITTDAAGDASPSWSPDGNTFAFTSRRGATQDDVWTIPVSGGTATNVTDRMQDDRNAVWSSDGNTLLYQSVDAPNSLWKVTTTPSSGGAATWLVTGMNPCWSPLDSMVAFTNSGDIYTIPPGLQITHTGDNWTPDWSPDGTTIAFASMRTGNSDIWIMPAAGGTARQITTDPAHDRAPRWSPDGKRIAFHSDRSGNNDIWTIAVQ